MSIAGNNLFNIDKGILRKDAFIVIIRTGWNAGIVDKLEEGAKNILDRYNVNSVTIFVPGAFEIPFAIKSYWENAAIDKPHAFIALGCVLRGDTPHFDYICKSVTDGITALNLSLPIPTIFGILTIDNQQQADERTGGKHGNKGEEAAITAIKMIILQDLFIQKNALPPSN